jgi:hypothetical protein
MPKTPFLITIDTEGDDLWSQPREITTRNASHLPRFQELCEQFAFRPVYLTNYEMARSPEFREFGRDVLVRNVAEIGMHLHAWNSPPLVPLTEDDFRYQPYLTEYPDEIMRDKIRVMTRLLEDIFQRPIVSHRAGRLGFDGRYAAMLQEFGYLVDCSVTPGIDWTTTPGAPGGRGGPDYTDFPRRPYFLQPPAVAVPADRGLLEVPVTVEPGPLARAAAWAYATGQLGRIANRIAPRLNWLCPGESRLGGMLQAARDARRRGAACVELMLHSSELMPGGSPTFRSVAAIERLYDDLGVLFEALAGWCQGMTLEKFHSQMTLEAAA